MGYKVLLTLDIEKASTEKRKLFYEYLKSQDWEKIPNLTTSWKASFNDNASREDVIATAKDDLKNAAQHAGVNFYNVALQMGKGLVVEF